MTQWQSICLPVQEVQETRVQFLGPEDTLEEEKTTPSSTLAWRILWTEETGRLVHRSERVEHIYIYIYIYIKCSLCNCFPT